MRAVTVPTCGPRKVASSHAVATVDAMEMTSCRGMDWTTQDNCYPFWRSGQQVLDKNVRRVWDCDKPHGYRIPYCR